MREPSKIYLRARIALLAIITLVLLVTVLTQYRTPPKLQGAVHPKSLIEAIRSGAVATTALDTNGLVPGDPDKAEEKLKEFGRCVKIYLKNHPDAFKDSTLAHSKGSSIWNLLFPDMLKNRSAYNLPDGLTPYEYFHNPDMKYSTVWASEVKSGVDLSHIVPFTASLLRPDGTMIGSPKAPDTRDIYAYTDFYVHNNFHFNAQDMMKSATNPVGFYLVLWEDGSVERVPFDKVVYAPSKTESNAYYEAFSGQAGLPADSVSYVEDYMKHHHGLKPNAGKPGILGYANDGTEVKNP